MLQKDACLTSSFKYLSAWNPLDKEAKTPPKIVVTCFIQYQNKILVLQRARKDIQYKLWGIPGGKLLLRESPIKGLLRELKEELGISFTSHDIQLLGTAKSNTLCDGEYGLYLFYLPLLSPVEIHINLQEHFAYKWVTLEEFCSLKLLSAQGEAFRIVEKQLTKLIKTYPFNKGGKRKIMKTNKNYNIHGKQCDCNASVVTVISGSFRKHLHYIAQLKKALIKCHVKVLSPIGDTAINPDEDFIILDADLFSDPKLLQDSVFAKIRSSTFLVVANFNGYLGNAAIMEIGYAIAIGIPIYSIEPIEDPNIKFYCKLLSEVFPEITFPLANTYSATHKTTVINH